MITERRNRIDLNTTSELAIRKSIEEVEKLGASVTLTNIVTLLDKVRLLLSDFVDEKLISFDDIKINDKFISYESNSYYVFRKINKWEAVLEKYGTISKFSNIPVIEFN